MMTTSEDKKPKPGRRHDDHARAALHNDFQLSVETGRTLPNLKAINAEILLLGGSKSPGYLKVALDALDKVLPNATRIELPGLNHEASGNKNRGGKPKRIAESCAPFLPRTRSSVPASADRRRAEAPPGLRSARSPHMTNYSIVKLSAPTDRLSLLSGRASPAPPVL